MHQISDVEVGCFLSSGVDSSYVVKEISKGTKKVKTFSVGYEAVSYTHLDVYKRQGQMYVSAKILPAGNTHSIFERGVLALINNDLPRILTPVSYTHLDVYKRQV